MTSPSLNAGSRRSVILARFTKKPKTKTKLWNKTGVKQSQTMKRNIPCQGAWLCVTQTENLPTNLWITVPSQLRDLPFKASLAPLWGRGAISLASRPWAELAAPSGCCSQPACLQYWHAHTWRHYLELWVWWVYLYGWHPDLLAYSCGFPWSAVMAYYLSICLQAWVTFNFLKLNAGKTESFHIGSVHLLNVWIYDI